jgi:hypothetical protein
MASPIIMKLFAARESEVWGWFMSWYDESSTELRKRWIDVVEPLNNWSTMHVALVSDAPLQVIQAISAATDYALELTLDKIGKTPLHCAAECSSRTEVVAWLIERCPPCLNIPNHSGHTPAVSARWVNSTLERKNIIAMLVKAERGVNKTCGVAQCGKESSRGFPMMHCSQCKVATHCSKACQQHAWKVHKKVCPQMKENRRIMNEIDDESMGAAGHARALAIQKESSKTYD